MNWLLGKYETALRIDWLRSEIEKLEKGRKDALQIRDMYFPNVIGEPVPNEDWADIVNWKNAHNTALTSIITWYKEELLELEKGV